MRSRVSLELPSLLEERAFAVWRRLLEGNRSGFPPFEDGLTADSLSFLRQAFGPMELAAEQYSGSGEGGERNPNADFEFWILGDDSMIGVRCQAKVIDSTLRTYPGLERRGAAEQAELLLRNRWLSAAKHREAGRVYRYPFYCLYTATENATVPFEHWYWRRSYGCSLVPAHLVLRKIRRSEVELSHLARHMTPWAWPFRGSRLERIEDELTGLFRGEDEAYFDDEGSLLPPGGDARVPLESAPAYVKKLAANMDAPVPRERDEFDAPEPDDLLFALLIRLEDPR